MSLENLVLITGQQIDQGVALEAGKTKQKYVQAAGVCKFDKEDFRKLGCLIGTPVKVSTEYGEVVVYSILSEEAPHPGIIFIPAGPWANQLVNPDSQGMGTPTYKGMKAKVEVVENGKVLGTIALLKKYKK
ncbi:MAG: putative formylmethanofuran dehydrogenase subunit D [Promethearchaeota archaeon]|nr:MAG: putative formylmethanofuran dehydrogenase subunit D [Candidatus Lokiarchaeota archaeon]